MKTLRLILGDQLNQSISSLQDINKSNDTIMLCEVMAEATYVKHHPQKIAFLFSAMRHFADELKRQGFKVYYVKIDDDENTGNFTNEIERLLKTESFQKIIVTEPGEYRLLNIFESWSKSLNVSVEIPEDRRFLCSLNEFKQWAKNKKQLRMEFFYREMRKKYRILMDESDQPIGGQWNYDKENRKPPRAGLDIQKRIQHSMSSITESVIKLVSQRFSNHFGTLEKFNFAVTREQALAELNFFIAHLLNFFGDFQDAMLVDEPYLYHSRLSAYLNAGLLLPLEVCLLAEDAYKKNLAPLNAVEGFIRQILGWREFVRGIYWQHMPAYAKKNYLSAKNKLPDFYWGKPTKMFCVAEAIKHTRDYAYSHHIQRLMITGNFALLAGIDPAEVCTWYLEVYADAYEWVELPNTLGMALFGDGGTMASKPYAASGKYIQRMSNYCKHCEYNVNETVGDTACPFNALYWDFLARHEDALKNNQRLAYMLANWHKMPKEKQSAIRKQAKVIFKKMSDNDL